MTVPWNEENAAHFLRRTGFGATPREIRRALRVGFERTLADRLRPDRKSDRLPAKVEDLFELQNWWLRRMRKSRSPLTEKLVLLWHNHFATGFAKVGEAYFMHLQNRTLRRGAMGPFRELVTDIARDPAMLIWLDNESNVKGNPNENFARELMELFTTGVLDQDGRPNYTELDVEEAARAFTGWGRDEEDGFVFFPEQHDFGQKRFRGLTGDLDGTDVIENLVTDRATARRVAWRLFSFFARPVPLADPVLDEFEQTYLDADTEIRPVLERLLRSDAFFAAETKHARVRGPAEFAVSTLRMLGARERGGREADLGELVAELGQALFQPPSVFGWPEGLGWLGPQGMLMRSRFAGLVAAGRRGETIDFRPERLLPGRRRRRDMTVEETLDALLSQLGPLEVGPTTRQALEAYLTAGEELDEGFRLTRETVDRKFRGLVALALSSPEFQVE